MKNIQIKIKKMFKVIIIIIKLKTTLFTIGDFINISIDLDKAANCADETSRSGYQTHLYAFKCTFIFFRMFYL